MPAVHLIGGGTPEAGEHVATFARIDKTGDGLRLVFDLGGGQGCEVATYLPSARLSVGTQAGRAVVGLTGGRVGDTVNLDDFIGRRFRVEVVLDCDGEPHVVHVDPVREPVPSAEYVWSRRDH